MPTFTPELDIPLQDLQINQVNSAFAGAHNFAIGQQINATNVTNNVTLIAKPFGVYDLQAELAARCLTEATHIRDRLRAPPDSQCLPGTRTKLIKQIKSWVNSGMLLKGVPSHVLWLYGYVGCGKSAVAQTIADTFSKKNRLAGSFFFFRSAGERSKTTRFPTTMASQMVTALPFTKLLVEDAWRAYGNSLANTPVHVQFLHLFLNPFQSAIRRPKGMAQSLISGPYLIVIDGLDECEDRQGIAALIDQINDFFKENPRFPLRFFISSRVEEHIRDRLKPESVQLIDLVKETSEGEVAYIVDEIFQNAAKHNWVIRSYGDWPSKDARRTLARYADRSLLLLSTVTKYILEPTDDGRTPKERLAVALDHKRGLDEIYTEVLSRSEKHRYFNTIISTLALTLGQYSIAALARLLSIDQGDLILVLQNLHAIFYVPGDEYSPVTFSHSSLREFLCSEERAKSYFAPPSHHKFLAYRFYENMEIVNDVPPQERVDDAGGSFRYHWKSNLDPFLNNPLYLRQELHGLLAHIRCSTSPTHYPSIHLKLTAFALLDRRWLAELLPRSRRGCQVDELVARFTDTRAGSKAWFNTMQIFAAVNEPFGVIASKLAPANLVDELSVLCDVEDAPVSPPYPSILSGHTFLATTCMRQIFTRPCTITAGNTGLRIVLMPHLDEPVRQQAHGELMRHVSGYSFWSFGIHLAMAHEHDPGFTKSFLIARQEHSESKAAREDKSAFEFLLSQRDYHVGFDEPGEYLPLFKDNFVRASTTINNLLSPQPIESLSLSSNWGFASVLRENVNVNGKYWAYGSHKDDFSILNIWTGYSLLAQCFIAKMEKTHDDNTCTLHQKYAEARKREGIP